MLRGAERRLGISVEIELGEERHGKRRSESLAGRGGIEHVQRQMAAALVRVDVFELSDPDRRGSAALRVLCERCSGRSRQQRAAKRGAARGVRPPLHQQEKFPDEPPHIVIAHAPVLSSTQCECKPAQEGLGPRFGGDERIFTSPSPPAQVRGIDFSSRVLV